MIRLENVIKLTGGRRAVNGVSLCIKEKERVLIHGVPGSGKSTLMRLIAGMDPPSAGEIYVLGEAVHAMNDDQAADFRNAHMGVMLREPYLLPRHIVLENVALSLAIGGIPIRQRQQAAKKQLKELRIGHMTHVRPEQLSTYEARVVSLARVLIAQPSILLLDEVFAGLSMKESEQLAGVIDAVTQFGKLTVVIFSASPHCIINADRTIEIEHGTIWEDRS